MKKTMHWIAAMTAILIASTAHAAEGEIVHVNLIRVLETFQQSDAASIRLKEEVGRKKKEFDIKKAELKKMREDLDAERESLNAEAREKREQGIQEKSSELINIISEAQRDLQTKEEFLKTAMIEQVQSALKAVGKENGYRYILEEGQRAILFADDSLDVTDAVIEKLAKD